MSLLLNGFFVLALCLLACLTAKSWMTTETAELHRKGAAYAPSRCRCRRA